MEQIQDFMAEIAYLAGGRFQLIVIASATGRLFVGKERLEAKVHVLLDVAMEKRKSGLVGNQIYCRAAVERYDHSVFHDSGGWLTVDVHEFE